MTVLLIYLVTYLAVHLYCAWRENKRLKADLQRLHHAHLDAIVRENKLNVHCADLERELRNAKARLAQEQPAQQPPVVCISVYKYGHLFSDN